MITLKLFIRIYTINAHTAVNRYICVHTEYLGTDPTYTLEQCETIVANAIATWREHNPEIQLHSATARVEISANI